MPSPFESSRAPAAPPGALGFREIEGAEEREWIMMGIINIASIMEYGRPGGVLREVGCVESKEVGGHGPQAASAITLLL